MAKAFKKKGNPTDEIPSVTNTEVVNGVTYGVADYNGRKTYFNMPETDPEKVNYYGPGTNTPTPVQDSDLNPHLFPGYNSKTGTIDNSNAVQSADILTPSQEKKVGKAFRKEIQFNKSLATGGVNNVTQAQLDATNKTRLTTNPNALPLTMEQVNNMTNPQYNIGDAEMLRNDQDPNNPQYASMSFVPFANNIMPGDEAFMASMKDATFAQPNFNQEEIDQNIGNMMRQNGWSYEQAYESVYGTKPTGPIPTKFTNISQDRNAQRQSHIDSFVSKGMSLEEATKNADEIMGKIPDNQGARINALATRWNPFPGQVIDFVMNSGDATKQVTTGTPVNQTVLPAGTFMGYGVHSTGKRDANGKLIYEKNNYQSPIFSSEFLSPEQQNLGRVVPSNYVPKPFRKQTTITNTTQQVAQPLKNLEQVMIDYDIRSPQLLLGSNFVVNSMHRSYANDGSLNPLQVGKNGTITSFTDKINEIKSGIENGNLVGIGKDKNIYPFESNGMKWYYNSKTGQYAPMEDRRFNL